MLKRPVYLLLFAFLSASFYGCKTGYNLATEQEELVFISTDREVRMGKSIAKQIENRLKPVEDVDMQNRVEVIGDRLSRVCDRQDITYYFKVLDKDEVNAVSLPGGFIYINRGLIEKVDNDDELAGVIGHELGHITARHAVKRLQGSLGYLALKLLIAGAGTSETRRGADTAFNTLLHSYSREDELLSDRLAVKYMKQAGYKPQAMLSFLDKLKEVHRQMPIRKKRHYRTHPYIPDRVRVVREEIFGKIRFEDYINIDQDLY